MPNQDNSVHEISKTSPDMRAQRIEQLKSLLPDLFDGEGKLDEKALRGLISNEAGIAAERFSFEWAGKQKSKRLAFTPSRATLAYDPTRSLNRDGTENHAEQTLKDNTSENLIIEGDNLEVLKLLQTTYFEQIKCIYIDPPYNTSNDFIYPDNFTEDKKAYWEKNGVTQDGVKLTALPESHGRKHSDWLNFMQSRLLLAWQLLRDDGAIIVHIDEHEIHRLRIVMEEIFGSNNFIGEIVWDKRNPKGDAGEISYQHESIICFVKNVEFFKETKSLKIPKKNANTMQKKAESYFKKVGKNCISQRVKESLAILEIKDNLSKYKREYKLDDANNDFQAWLSKQINFSGGELAYKYIDKDGKVYRPVSMAWPNNKKAPDDYFKPLTHPKTNKLCPVPAKGWRNPPATMQDLLQKNQIIFGENEKSQPNRKYFLSENMEENLPSLLYYGASDDVLLSGMNIVFDNPKPVNVARRIIQSFSKSDDLILDFFAGSGTSAHAVMQQNATDGGNRKHIMVQIPELTDEKSEAYKAGYKTISDITIERVKRAGAKICTENPEANIDTGFRVFKLTHSHFAENLFTPDADKSEAENIQALEEHLAQSAQLRLFTKDEFSNLVTEISLKNGFGLFYQLETMIDFTHNEVYRLHGNGKSVLLCLDDNLHDDSVEKLKPFKDEQLMVSKFALDTSKKFSLQTEFNDNLWVV